MATSLNGKRIQIAATAPVSTSLGSAIIASIQGQEWRKDAMCATAPDPDLWHEDRTGPKHLVRIFEAKRLCGMCLVKAECLEYALGQPAAQDHGIWGGTDLKERAAMRAASRREAYNAARREMRRRARGAA